MLNFLLLVLFVLVVISIIVVGLLSLVVFIEGIFNPDDIDPDLWKE